jgi:hypothetical protein
MPCKRQLQEKNVHIHVTKAIIALKSLWKLLRHIWKPISLPAILDRLREVDEIGTYSQGHTCLHQHVVLINKGIEQALMKNGFFWDVTPCGSCKNRRFAGT